VGNLLARVTAPSLLRGAALPAPAALNDGDRAVLRAVEAASVAAVGD